MTTRAIVLAGSSCGRGLQKLTPGPSKAAVRLYGRPMLEYVVDALLRARSVRDVTVVGAPNLVTMSAATRRAVSWTSSGATLSQSLQNGLQHIKADESVLVVACDLPLLSPQSVDEFLAHSLNSQADIVYPIIPRDVMREALPGARRTFFRVTEGAYTAGNMALIGPRFPRHALQLLDEAARRRKHPTLLGRMLGWPTFWGVALGRLSLPELQARIRKSWGISVLPHVLTRADVGFDVDSCLDLGLALRCLNSDRARLGTPTPQH